MIQEFYFAFTLGIVGSLHCIQMCGPLVLSYSMPLVGFTRGRQIGAHLFYNIGRITTYSALGLVAGTAGAAAGTLGKLTGVEHIVTITAGAVMIAAGILMSGWIPLGKAYPLYAVKPAAFISKRVGSLLKSSDIKNKYLMGIILGFLPCGLVYTALIKAVESGDPISGAITMACFGLGTVWTLLLLGIFSSTISHWLRRRANALAAIGVTLMGVFLLYKGIAATIGQSHMHH